VNWRLTCEVATLWPFADESWNAFLKNVPERSVREPWRMTSKDCVGFCCAALSSALGM
jgi:hypothetical protein